MIRSNDFTAQIFHFIHLTKIYFFIYSNLNWVVIADTKQFRTKSSKNKIHRSNLLCFDLHIISLCDVAEAVYIQCKLSWEF